DDARGGVPAPLPRAAAGRRRPPLRPAPRALRAALSPGERGGAGRTAGRVPARHAGPLAVPRHPPGPRDGLARCRVPAGADRPGPVPLFVRPPGPRRQFQGGAAGPGTGLGDRLAAGGPTPVAGPPAGGPGRALRTAFGDDRGPFYPFPLGPG